MAASSIFGPVLTACLLLSGGERSVKEVACELGYPDAFTFSRQFRKVMGVPPSHLRGT